MGEITIQVPNRTRRRYRVEDRALANELLTTLERSAVRLNREVLSESQREDLADLEDVKRAVAEFVRTGKVIPLADLKTELGL